MERFALAVSTWALTLLAAWVGVNPALAAVVLQSFHDARYMVTGHSPGRSSPARRAGSAQLSVSPRIPCRLVVGTGPATFVLGDAARASATRRGILRGWKPRGPGTPQGELAWLLWRAGPGRRWLPPWWPIPRSWRRRGRALSNRPLRSCKGSADAVRTSARVAGGAGRAPAGACAGPHAAWS